MITREAYADGAHRPLIERYRGRAEGCTGSEKGKRLYLEGAAHGERAETWDERNCSYSYDFETHSMLYEWLGKRCFRRAIRCFKASAKEGNDLSMMVYGLYLFSFKSRYAEGIRWFERASEAGLACADYQLAAIYENGYRSDVAADPARAQAYRERYLHRISESERELMLAWDLEEPCKVLGEDWLFAWYHAFPFPLFHDTFNAFPSKWKCGITNREIKRLREIARGGSPK